MPTSRPRSLADDLRARTDAALVALLRARPDLLSPVPSDLASLAARAATRPSVSAGARPARPVRASRSSRCCARCPDHSTEADVRRLLGADPTAVLDLLHERALVYRDDEGGLRRPAHRRGGRRAPGRPRPGRRAGAAHLRPGAGWRRSRPTWGCPRPATRWRPRGRSPASSATTAGCAPCWPHAPAGAADALATMVWGPPTGHLERARRDVDAGSAGSPVEWLLAHALLVGTDTATVVLPREVALHLRGGRVHQAGRAGAARPRHLAGRHRATSTGRPRAPLPTRCGWSRSCSSSGRDDPPKVLRTGGVGRARAVPRARGRSTSTRRRLALLIETAHAAGLLAAGDDGRDTAELWLPTPAYDGWLDSTVAERWLVLAQAWLASPPGCPAWSAAATSGAGPCRRSAPTWTAPSRRPSGPPCWPTSPRSPTGVATTSESLSARLRWQAPRRGGRLQDELVTWTRDRGADARAWPPVARWPGTAGCWPPATARPRSPRSRRRCRRPLDHVLLQADLTAVAPGPLEPALARSLRLVADIESTGGATVYRFTEATVRRAFDAGWTAGDVTGLLARHSRTPVPQPLTYLVDDVGRRHGRVRVGAASSFVRCDDESILERAAQRPAGGVTAGCAVHRADRARLLGAGRRDCWTGCASMGLAPAAEGARRRGRRTPARVAAHHGAPATGPGRDARRRLPATPCWTPPSRRSAAATGPGWSVRCGRRGPPRTCWRCSPRPPAPARRSGSATSTPRAGRRQRVVEPVAVEGGYLNAYDHLRGAVRSFAVHRITGVSALDEETVS